MTPLTSTHNASIERVPGWQQFPWLRAGFSTREGGLSAVYGPAEQNLGWTAEDDPAIVMANRDAFVRALGGDAPNLALVTVKQVHGASVRQLESETSPWMGRDGKAKLEGDGMISLTPGRLLAILTADCVPVLFADTRTRAVGVVHAGWRGTLARIAERGVAAMQADFGSRPQDLIAAIGPCIHACCFEVGEEVRSAFMQEFPYAEDLFPSAAYDSLHMNLVRANHHQLLDAGLALGNIRIVSECTACTRRADGGRKFFSYRAERGVTGRMLSAIAAVA